MVWIDVEIYNWTANLTANREFITKLVSQLKKRNAVIGVYTSERDWRHIVGLDWTNLHELPLWYSHFDNNPTFSDFLPFGGWTKPSIKQYSPDV